MKTILFTFLYASFVYVYPIYKLPFGNVSHMRLDDFVFIIILLSCTFFDKDKESIKRDEIYRIFLLYIIYLGLTLLIASFRGEGILRESIKFAGFFYIKFWQYFIIYILVRTCKPFKNETHFRILFCSMVIYTSVAAILQSKGIITLRYDPTIPQNMRHATSTLSFNYAHLGLFQLVSIGMLMGFLETAKHRTKVFYLILILVAFYALMLSGSRAGIIGTAVVLVVHFSQTRVKGIYIAMLTSALIVLAITGIPDIFLSRMSTTLDSDATGAGRVESWLHLTDFFNDSALNVIFGVGFMQFRFSAIQFFHSNAGHNNYLNTYVETGMIGFIIFLMLLIVVFKQLRKNSKNSIYARNGLAIWCGIIVTCLSQESLSVVFAMQSFMGFLFFTLGVIQNNVQSKSLPHNN
jgi:O-antigen ligase